MRAFGNALIVLLKGTLNRPYEIAILLVGSLSMVVIMLTFLGMKAGLDRILTNAGSENLLLVLGNGAETEVMSAFATSEVNSIITAARMSSRDELVASPEVYTNIRVGKGDGGPEIIAIRGIMPAGFDLRRNFRILSGRRFDPGRRELIAGRELVARLPWIDVGSNLVIGDEFWTVVGTFGVDETATESELLGGATLLQDALRRQGVFQSIRLGKVGGGNMDDVIDNIKNNISNNTTVKIFKETQYYHKQIEDLETFIDYITIPSIIILFIATSFSSINSMYIINKSFDNDIAIMRTIGYKMSTMISCVALISNFISLSGISLGILFAFAILNNTTTSMMNFSSFSNIFFDIDIDRQAVFFAAIFAWSASLPGTLASALGVARRSIIQTLRA
ncbi:MAG: hypothetical protein Tsb008_06890 [Rhodothalassiaceae bacterium]